MSKRSSQYKGRPRDGTRKHAIRQLAHLHNMEQRGIHYPKSINIHNLGDRMQLLMDFFNKKIALFRRSAEMDNELSEEEIGKRLKEIHKQAEYAAAMLKKRFFKQEVGSCYDPHQSKRERGRRLQREFGNVYISHLRESYPQAANSLEEMGLVEPPYGGDDDDLNHSLVTPWKTGVRENVEMIRMVGHD